MSRDRVTTLRPCGTCGHENAEHVTYPAGATWDAGEYECAVCFCPRFTEPIDDTYRGPTCTNLSTAGDWCGACEACERAVRWLRNRRPRFDRTDAQG